MSSWLYQYLAYDNIDCRIIIEFQILPSVYAWLIRDMMESNYEAMRKRNESGQRYGRREYSK